MRRAHVAAALVLAAAAGAGCGYSVSAAGARPVSGSAKVFVAPFANRTSDAEAGALVSAALREELARRGAAGGEGSSARIEGTVTRATAAPVNVQSGTWRLAFDVEARLLVDGTETAAVTVHREVDYLGEVDALATEGRRRLAIRRAAAETAQEVADRLESP